MEMVAIRRIDIQATSTGVDQAAAALDKLGKAHDDVAVSSTKTERATLSLERSYDRIQRQFDATYRAEQQLARTERELSAARSQGLLSLSRQTELMEMARQRVLGLSNANDNAAASSSRFARSATEIATNLSPLSGIAGSIASALGPVGIGLGVLAAMAAPIAAAGSEWTGYTNRLKAAGVEQGIVNQRMQELTGMALRSRSGLAPTVELYAGLTKSTQELGKSQTDVARVTETVTKAFSIGGQSAASASGAILQLNQAFAAGALRGDELNSVLEGAPPLARLIAKEFGVGVGELKRLGEEGRLTAERVFSALLKGSNEIDATFAKTNPTISQGLDAVKTGLVALGAEVDKSSGLSKLMASGLELIGKAAADAAKRVDEVRLAGENMRTQNLQTKLDQLRGTDMQFALSLSIPGRANPELERVKAEIVSVEQQLAQSFRSIEDRIQGMVGLPDRVLRPMSDELYGLVQAADSASAAMSATGSAASAAGNAMATATGQARGFAEALNAIRAANPDLAPVLGMMKQVGEVQKNLAEGTRGVMKQFHEGGIGDSEAQSQIKKLTDEAATSVKALREQFEKPFNSYARTAEIGAMGELQGKIAKAGDSFQELRSKAVVYFDELARSAATPEARGAIEAQRTQRLAEMDKAYNQVLATERKGYAERQAKKSASSSSVDGFDSTLQRYEDETVALKLQQEQASRTGVELYKLQAVQRLQQAAFKAGREGEKGLADDIERTAAAYANQRQATEDAIAAQRRMNEAIRETGDQLADLAENLLTGDFASAMKSLGRDSLRNSLSALFIGSGPLAVSAGLAPTEKGGVGGIFGTDFFKQMTKAVSSGTEGGWTSLFGSAQQGPLPNGKTLDTLTGSIGNLAGVMQGIGAIGGAYGIGASAGSMGQALVGGGLSGAMGGASLATALGMSGLALPGVGLILGAGAAPYGNRSVTRKEKIRERAQRLDQ